jgi:hypothetical protein
MGNAQAAIQQQFNAHKCKPADATNDTATV